MKKLYTTTPTATSDATTTVVIQQSRVVLTTAWRCVLAVCATQQHTHDTVQLLLLL